MYCRCNLVTSPGYADPGARWQKYAGRKAVFGYKAHVVLCRDACLPLFVLVTPAHVHDSQIGWLIVLLTGLFYAIRESVVYADAAYFDSRMFKVVHDFLGAHPAINYNLRKVGKQNSQPCFSSNNGGGW